MPKLTDATVRNAKPSATRYELSESSGLALRVSRRGGKSWVWRYRYEGTQKRITLGSYPQMSLSQARTALAVSQDKLARHIDPADDRPTRETVAELVELYRVRHLPKLRSAEERQRRLRVEVMPAIGHLKLAEVTRRRLGDLLHDKARTAPVSANRLRSLLVHLFRCGVDWGLLDSSPAASLTNVTDERSRDTVLSDEQIAAIWAALVEVKDPRIGRIIALLLLTGQRVSEVCGIHHDEIDLEAKTWTLPGARAKNGRQHVVPLSEQAVAVVCAAIEEFPGGYLFPAVSKRQPYVHQHSIGQAWRRLCRLSGLAGVTPHDIRRTVATGMGALGTQPHVIEAVLNHVSGHRAGVAGTYQRYAYEDEKRAALESWSTEVSKLNVAPAGQKSFPDDMAAVGSPRAPALPASRFPSGDPDAVSRKGDRRTPPTTNSGCQRQLLTSRPPSGGRESAQNNSRAPTTKKRASRSSPSSRA